MTLRTQLFAWTASAVALVFSGAAAQASGFSSPSGNIRCFVDTPSEFNGGQMPMVCLIFDADWSNPPDYGDGDPTCDLDRTRTLILPRNGPATVRWTCHGDVFWPAPLGKISYGSEWSVLGYTCTMATSGVTCENGRGNGFHVRRATRSLY